MKINHITIIISGECSGVGGGGGGGGGEFETNAESFEFEKIDGSIDRLIDFFFRDVTMTYFVWFML